VALSTKALEPTPGDMLRNPQLVFEKAEEMGAIYRQNQGLALEDQEGFAMQCEPWTPDSEYFDHSTELCAPSHRAQPQGLQPQSQILYQLTDEQLSCLAQQGHRPVIVSF